MIRSVYERNVILSGIGWNGSAQTLEGFHQGLAESSQQPRERNRSAVFGSRASFILAQNWREVENGT